MATSSRIYSENRPLRVWSHVRTLLLCGGGLAVLNGLSTDPAWVEAHFINGFGTTLAATTTWLTHRIPFALAEVLVVLLVVYVLLRTLEALSDMASGRRQIHNALLGGALHGLSLALFFGLWFQLAWGLSYQRVPAAQRYDLGDVDAAASLGVADLRELVAEATRRTNDAYRELHGSNDAGVVTEPRKGLDVDAALEVAWTRWAEQTGLSEALAAPRGPTKRPYLAWVLSYLGISGVYSPFTGEALVNGASPAWSQVHTAGHEKAHQRMIASEDEASFVAFMVCQGSSEPLLRYAGWQFARRTLQSALFRIDPDAGAFIEGKLGPGPQMDMLAVTSFWDRYEGPAQAAQELVNDSYLKSQGVHDGVRSYGRAATLVAAWMKLPKRARGPDPAKPSKAKEEPEAPVNDEATAPAAD